MPKIKNGSSVVHPNSRKALQISRQLYRENKLERRREESCYKLEAKLNKLNWFHDNIDVTKTHYSSEEIKDLVERYLKRLSEQEKLSNEKKNMKGRHNTSRLTQDYKLKFIVDHERQQYETSGLEVPNLTKEESFKYFKNWDKDSRFLTNIEMTTVSKKKSKVE